MTARTIREPEDGLKPRQQKPGPMAKGSGGPSWSFGAFFVFRPTTESEANVSKACKPKGAGKAKTAKKGVIASRKSCSATGTGLSHYILTDRKAK